MEDTAMNIFHSLRFFSLLVIAMFGLIASGGAGRADDIADVKATIAAFHQALGLFSPFAAAKPPPNGAAHGANGAAAETPKGDAAAAKPDIDELRVQLAEMRRRLDSLTDKPES